METQNKNGPSNLNQPIAKVLNEQSPASSITSNITVSPVVENVISQTEQVKIKYAGFWIRWGASFLDGLVLFGVGFVIGIFLGLVGAILRIPETIIAFLSQIIGILTSWTYFIYMTHKYQATLGKKVLGIKVYSNKLEKSTLGKIILRETIGKFVSAIILLVGYIMAGFTDKKQALHDMMADTVVIYNDPTKKTPVWILIVASVLPVIAFFGIILAVILTSLSVARLKAQEFQVKQVLTSVIAEAAVYTSAHSSYLGFKSKADVVSCSGEPIINISSDGKQIAIFMKSCLNSTKYFCADSTKNIIGSTADIEVDYVKSGAATCISQDAEFFPTLQ